MDYEQRSSELWEEIRFTIDEGGTGLTMDGLMALYDKPSRVLSAADLSLAQRSQLARFGRKTFVEVLHPGAFSKSLSESPDIVLHYQHDERTLPLGRTTAGTLRLTEADGGVRSQADLPDNEWGRPVRDAVKRGDIGGISYRMGAVIDRWANEKLGDYSGPVRHIHEVRLRREISLVTFPAYDTVATVRELAEQIEAEPDELAQAMNVLREPEGKLSAEQRDMLFTAINHRVDEPLLHPKVAAMRDRLRAELGG